MCLCIRRGHGGRFELGRHGSVGRRVELIEPVAQAVDEDCEKSLGVGVSEDPRHEPNLHGTAQGLVEEHPDALFDCPAAHLQRIQGRVVPEKGVNICPKLGFARPVTAPSHAGDKDTLNLCKYVAGGRV